MGCVISALWDFLLELLRGTCGLSDGTRVGISGIGETLAIFAALRELALDVALEGNLLGNSMPLSPISMPGSMGGTSDTRVAPNSPSSSDSSSSDPRGLTRFSFSGAAAAAAAFDGPALDGPA